MRLSEVVQILARRLDVRPGRVSGIASRLQHAGLLPITEGSRRYPPDVELPHVVALILAVAADRGLGNAARPHTKSARDYLDDFGQPHRRLQYLRDLGLKVKEKARPEAGLVKWAVEVEVPVAVRGDNQQAQTERRGTAARNGGP